MVHSNPDMIVGVAFRFFPKSGSVDFDDYKSWKSAGTVSFLGIVSGILPTEKAQALGSPLSLYVFC